MNRAEALQKKAPPAGAKPGAESKKPDNNTIAPITGIASGKLLDYNEIEKFLRLMAKPGETRQLRRLPGGLVFTLHDGETNTAELKEWLEKHSANGGLYYSLNPARVDIKGVQRNETTDHRELLLIDVDPERPSGTAATGTEKDAARQVADAVRAHLAAQSFTEPAVIDSGNGIHIIYRLPVGITTQDNSVAAALRNLAAMFNTPAAKIDTAVADAARIARLPGTMNRKGDNTAERPHRMARLVSAPPTLEPIPATVWRAFTASAPAPSEAGKDSIVPTTTGKAPELLTGEEHEKALARFKAYLDGEPAAKQSKRNFLFNIWLGEAKRQGVQRSAAVEAIAASGKDGGYIDDPTENAAAVAKSIYRNAAIVPDASWFDPVEPEEVAAAERQDKERRAAAEAAEREHYRKIIAASRRTASYYREHPAPPQEWIFRDGLPFERGYVVSMYAPGGGGKSSFASQFAIAAARGLPFLGRRVELKRNGENFRVGYVTFEESDEDVNRRTVEQMNQADEYAKSPFDPIIQERDEDFLEVAPVENAPEIDPEYYALDLSIPPFELLAHEHAIKVRLSRFGETLADELKERGTDIVFLDNTAKLFCGEENARNQVSGFYVEVTRFAKRANAMVILMAHTNKQGSFSGSTAFSDAGRALLETRVFKGGDRTIYSTEVRKVNGAKAGLTFLYEWKAGYWFKAVTEDDWRDVQRAAKSGADISRPKELAERILKVLNDNGGAMFKKEITRALLDDDEDTDTSKVQTALNRLVDSGEVQAKRTGKARQNEYSVAE